MTVNILDMVKGALGGQGIGQIGQLLGEDETKTSSAISAALPAILGGFMKQSSTQAGADELFQTAKHFDGNLLSNLGSALTGGQHSSLIQTGIGLISSLFGAKQSGLISSIARMAGIGQNSAGSLLGLLAPIVMSALSRARSNGNLNADGLANLLEGQKSYVSKALAPELGTDLGLDRYLAQAATNVRNVDIGTSRVPPQRTATRSGNGLLGKLLPLVLLAGLGWLGYKYLMPATEPMVASDKARVTNVVKGATMNVDELTGKLSATVGDMTSMLSGITDAESANSAVEKIKGAISTLDGLSLDDLAAPTKTAVSGTAGPLLGKLKAALETAYAIPGVKAVLDPILGPTLSKLTALVG